MTLLKSWWRWMLLCLACADGWHLLFVQQELWLMPALHSEMVPPRSGGEERGNSQFHGSQALLWKMR